jgi:hypothetical protein
VGDGWVPSVPNISGEQLLVALPSSLASLAWRPGSRQDPVEQVAVLGGFLAFPLLREMREYALSRYGDEGVGEVALSRRRERVVRTRPRVVREKRRSCSATTEAKQQSARVT